MFQGCCKVADAATASRFDPPVNVELHRTRTVERAKHSGIRSMMNPNPEP